MRIEALAAAQLLSAEEAEACEDTIADFTEAKASWASRLTMDVMHTSLVVGRAHKMVALSEALLSDAAFARQLRRKCLQQTSA